MKKIYLVLLLVSIYTVNNAQKVYFKQNFDYPTLDGSTNYISAGDYYGPPVPASSAYIQIAPNCFYSSPTPDSSQFTFIGTSATGTDSIVPDGNGGYALMLNKVSGTSNSATLVRSVPLADSAPSFLVIGFDLTPGQFSTSKVSNSFYCSLGLVKDTMRSESTTTGLTTRLAISSNGGSTNIFRLRDPGTPTAMGVDSFPTGSKYHITFIANDGDSTVYHTYTAPNGTIDSVLGTYWDAWITDSVGNTTKELTGRKMPKPSNPMQGFRFLITNTPQVAYILDNILITDGASSTLPISLAKFDAAKINETSASISWSVASATNIKEFAVTKSTDGTIFKSIGTVPFAGTKDYTFNDNSLGAGTSYYRLTSIAKNGAEQYSGIASVVNKISGTSIISLVPNLVHSTATLNISAAKADAVSTRVLDLVGRTVQEKSINIPEGNSQASFNFTTLKAGSYFLETISSDGSIKTIRFEKQ